MGSAGMTGGTSLETKVFVVKNKVKQALHVQI